ncbi:MAG: CPBP family intramembrane glutamic endopeptidase [Geodermatophilaceae bacterium]
MALRSTQASVLPRRMLGQEMVLVLALSLGASAIYSIIDIVAALSAPTPLAEQTSTLNASQAPDRPYLDLTLQLVRIGLHVVPALLAIHFLSRTNAPALRGIGLDWRRPGWDSGVGAGLALLIGVPGLLFYLLSRELGINTTVVATGLPEQWWQYPVLIAAALQNAVLEEVIVVGYLLTRLRQLGWSPWAAILASSVLRGAYHLYQGFGGFLGNFVMGLVFGWLYQRKGRVAPLIIAHTLLDVVAFIGYALLVDRVGFLS